MPLEGLVDHAKERARLEKEAEKLSKDLAAAEERLANENFTRHAPREEVEKISARRADAGGRLARLREIIKDLG